MSVRVVEGQSIMDIAVQVYGSPDAIVDLLWLNPELVNFAQPLEVGQLLQTAPPTNAVSNYYKVNAIQVITSSSFNGIGGMIIGENFIVGQEPGGVGNGQIGFTFYIN